jgi:hypothetical protein
MILANKFHQHFHRKTQKAALQRMNNRISLLRIQPVDSSIHPSHISPPLVKMLYVLVLLVFMLNSVCLEAASDSSSYSIRLPGHPYESSWEETVDDDAGVGRAWVSSGREFSLFDSRGVTSRGGAGSGGPFDSNYIYNRGTQRRTQEDDDDDDDDDDDTSDKNRRPFRSRYGSSGGRYNYKNGPRSLPSRDKKRTPEIFQTLSDWWATTITPTIKDWPKIQCRVEPTTTLKIRKTFRPLKTIVRFGADFNTQLGVWQFKSSWEDAIIGGKLTLAGRELQLTKSWQLSVGTNFISEIVYRRKKRSLHFLAHPSLFSNISTYCQVLSKTWSLAYDFEQRLICKHGRPMLEWDFERNDYLQSMSWKDLR